VGVFVVMVAVDVADWSCEGQRRMTDQVLCVSRRASSLLTPVLSPAGPFCAVITLLRDCSPVTFCMRRFLVLQFPIAAVWDTLLSSVSLDAYDGDAHPHTTGNNEVACSEPRCRQMIKIVALFKLVLGFIRFYLYNYVTKCCQFKDFWSFSIPC
jgi:hypothetical protein